MLPLLAFCCLLAGQPWRLLVLSWWHECASSCMCPFCMRASTYGVSSPFLTMLALCLTLTLSALCLLLVLRDCFALDWWCGICWRLLMLACLDICSCGMFSWGAHTRALLSCGQRKSLCVDCCVCALVCCALPSLACEVGDPQLSLRCGCALLVCHAHARACVIALLFWQLLLLVHSNTYCLSFLLPVRYPHGRQQRT